MVRSGHIDLDAVIVTITSLVFYLFVLLVVTGVVCVIPASFSLGKLAFFFLWKVHLIYSFLTTLNIKQHYTEISVYHSSSGCMVVWCGMHMISVCKAIRKIVHPLTSQSPVFTYLLFLKWICISSRVTTWLLKNRSLLLDVNFAAKSFQLQLTSVDNLPDLEITSYFRTTVPFKCWWQLQMYCVPRGGINNNVGESCLCVAVWFSCYDHRNAGWSCRTGLHHRHTSEFWQPGDTMLQDW